MVEMKKNGENTGRLIPDRELGRWIETNGEGTRELIVEAKLPRTKVAFERGKPSRPNVADTNPDNSKSRQEILAELASYVSDIVGKPPNIIKSAGALALIATVEQAKLLARHHLVKAIRPNRRLGTRADVL